MISSLTLAQSYIQILKQNPQEKEGIFADGFVAFLEESGLLHQLPSIVRYLEHYAQKYDEFNTLLVESPFEIEENVLKSIQSFVGAPPKTAHTFKKNINLIGGFRARFQGTIVDASVQNTLQALTQQLTK